MSERFAGCCSAADVRYGMGCLPDKTAAPTCVCYRDFTITHPMNEISYEALNAPTLLLSCCDVVGSSRCE
jgi:hypothetical protein